MKIFGIICEYNPFHNGHARQLEFCRSNGADLIFCAMSGDFTQRGEPAVLEKRIRAKHAVQSGADLVAELPLPYAAAGAKDFAEGGVKLLEKMGCTHICFGSECGNISLLEKAAELIDSDSFNNSLKLHIKAGKSYPVSAELAGEEYGGVLSAPNNILAVEYLRALKSVGSAMRPITLTRNTDYCSESLDSKACVASASAIRKNLKNEALSEFVPPYVAEDLNKSGKEITREYGDFAHAFLNLCSKEYLNGVEGVTEGLENRISAAACEKNFDAFFNALKTKRYTSSRLKRVILNAVLGVTKNFAEQCRKTSPPLLLLAAKKDCKGLKTLNPSFTEESSEITQRIKELTLCSERFFCAIRQIPFSSLKKLEKY